MSHLVIADAAHGDNAYSKTGDTADCMLDFSYQGNLPDANPHTFYYANLTEQVRSTMEWVRANVVEPTSFTTTLLSAETEPTDVVVYDEDYSTYCLTAWHTGPNDPGGSVIGQVICRSATNAGYCEKHELRTDLSWWNKGQSTREQRSHLCHEVAHTMGLDHGNPSSCTYWSLQGSLSPEKLHEHDFWMVNGGPWRLLSGSSYMPDRRHENEFMSSPNGRFRLWLQADANLVLYDGSTAVWSSGRTNANTNWLVEQSDGNVVQYATNGLTTWVVCAFGTYGNPGAFVKVQDDGNIVVADPYDRVLWSRFGGGQCR